MNFAVIGDALPREKRAMGFTLQSMLKRVQMVVSPLVVGALIAGVGVARGVKIGLATTRPAALVAGRFERAR